jgi:hypothetical protein
MVLHNHPLLLEFCRSCICPGLLFVALNAHSASYPYSADIGENAVRNGSNDFSVKISLRADGKTLETNAVIHKNVPTTNGTATLNIYLHDDVSGVTRFWLWLGVKASGSTNDFSVLPPKKVKLEKKELVPFPRDPIRGLLILGMLGLIVIEARRKFVIPAADRYSTTRFKYEMAAGLYSLIWVVPFFAFLYSPDVLYFFLGKELELFVSLPFPIVAGIGAAYALPHMPKVADFYRWIQSHLKAFAEIPAQLRWLHGAIARAEFQFDVDALAAAMDRTPAELSATLPQHGLTQTQPLSSDWLRAANLYAKLKQLNVEERYMSFFQQESKAWQDLATGFKQCLESAKAGLLGKPCQTFYSNVYMFAARLVLYCGITGRGRQDILRHRLGLKIQTSIEGVTFHQMIVVFLLLLFITVIGLLFFTGSSLESPESRLLKGLMISLIYVFSVASAVYTSRRTSATAGYEWATYFFASAVSIAVAFVFAFAFGIIAFDGDIGSALINSRLKYPYLVSAGITCFATCIMLDTKATAQLTARRLRLIESLSGVLIGLALAVGIRFLLSLELEYLRTIKSVLVALLTVPPIVYTCA